MAARAPAKNVAVVSDPQPWGGGGGGREVVVCSRCGRQQRTDNKTESALGVWSFMCDRSMCCVVVDFGIFFFSVGYVEVLNILWYLSP